MAEQTFKDLKVFTEFIHDGLVYKKLEPVYSNCCTVHHNCIIADYTLDIDDDKKKVYIPENTIIEIKGE